MLNTPTDARIAELIGQRDRLVKALKEMRDVAAAAMRVLGNHTPLVDMFGTELHLCGIKDGFGKRADNLIAEIETE